jgi:hypothetical protein
VCRSKPCMQAIALLPAITTAATRMRLLSVLPMVMLLLHMVAGRCRHLHAWLAAICGTALKPEQRTLLRLRRCRDTFGATFMRAIMRAITKQWLCTF